MLSWMTIISEASKEMVEMLWCVNNGIKSACVGLFDTRRPNETTQETQRN